MTWEEAIPDTDIACLKCTDQVVVANTCAFLIYEEGIEMIYRFTAFQVRLYADPIYLGQTTGVTLCQFASDSIHTIKLAQLNPEKKSLESFHQRLPEILGQLDGQEVGYALLEDANPSVIKRSFGAATLAQAGKGVREKS